MAFRGIRIKLGAVLAALLVVTMVVTAVSHADHLHQSSSESAACAVCHFHQNLFFDVPSSPAVELERVLSESELILPQPELFLKNFLASSSRDRAPPLA